MFHTVVLVLYVFCSSRNREGTTISVGAIAYPVSVIPFDVCKVKWLPHPERLLSAVVCHSIGCDPQPGASFTAVISSRSLLTEASRRWLEPDWRSV